MWATSTENGAAALRWRLLASALGAFLAWGCSGNAVRAPSAVADDAAAPDPAAVARYDAALGALAAGDEAAAEAVFRALVDEYPGYSGPMVNLAIIETRRGQVEPAAALLAKAVAVCASCAPAWNELGVLQRRQGQFAQAEQSYLRAIAADPRYANAHFNLGVLYDIYLRRPELALDQYERFRELGAADPAGSDVDKWIADLKRRTQVAERTAQIEEAT